MRLEERERQAAEMKRKAAEAWEANAISKQDLLENDDAVKDNPWAPMRISLHGESAVLALSSPVVRSAILRRGHPLIFTMLIQPTLPSELLEMTAPGSLARTCILGCFSLSFVGTLKTTISTRSIT